MLARFGYEFFVSLGQQAMDAGMIPGELPAAEEPAPEPKHKRKRKRKATRTASREGCWERPAFLDPERQRRTPEPDEPDEPGEVERLRALVAELQGREAARIRDRRDVGRPESRRRRSRKQPQAGRPSAAPAREPDAPTIAAETEFPVAPVSLGTSFATTAPDTDVALAPASPPTSAPEEPADASPGPVESPTQAAQPEPTPPVIDEPALEQRIVAGITDKLTELLAPVAELVHRIDRLEQRVDVIEAREPCPDPATEALVRRVEELEQAVKALVSKREPPAPDVSIDLGKLALEIRLVQLMLVAFSLMLGSDDAEDPSYIYKWIDRAHPALPDVLARCRAGPGIDPRSTGPPDSDRPRESDA